jgi:hypothetical protein
MSAIAQALTDKDFLQAQPPDQKKYLASVDPDFAKASPADQDAYHAHVVLPAVMAHSKQINAQPTQFEKEHPAGIDPKSPGASSVSREGPVMRGLKAVGSDVANAGMGLVQQVPGMKTIGAIGRGDLKGAAMSLIPGADVGEKVRQMQELVKHDTSRKGAGYSPLYRGAAALGETTGTVDPTGMEESAKHGDTAGVVGHTVLPLAGAAVGADEALTGGKGLRAIGDAIPSRTDIGLAARTEKGTLKPAVRTVARVGGALAGHALGVPGLGEIGGLLAGPSLADAILPKRPFDIPTKGAEVGAPLPEAGEFYANKAKEMDAVRKQTEQAARQSERQAKTNSPEPAAAEGPGLPNAKVVKLPVPREPVPGENPGYMASIPRGRLLDLGRQGRPGAGTQLQNIGKSVLYVPEEYPGPRTTPFEGPTNGGLQSVGGVRQVGARPVSEIYQRPAEVPAMAGRGAPPVEMNAAELAEIRKESGHPEMTAEEAHRWRINKLGERAASTAPLNDLGGMKRAGDEGLVPRGNPSLAAQRLARERAQRIREARP